MVTSHSEEGDAQFDCAVNAQRIPANELETWKPDAADAEAPHEGGQQDAERYGRGPQRELQDLIPGDFVDQRRTAAAGEEDKEERKVLLQSWAPNRVAYHGSIQMRSAKDLRSL